MVYRIIATCCLALLVPAAVLAQSPVKTPEQLTKDVQDLQQKLTTTAENLTKLAAASRQEYRGHHAERARH